MVENMDIIVRIVCVGLILILGFVLFGNVKLLIESNEGKKFVKAPRIQMKKPKIVINSLMKATSFFLMINHGPDLCKIDEEIVNIPYYKGKSYLLTLGDNDEKN